MWPEKKKTPLSATLSARSPTLHHVNPDATEPLQTEAQVCTPAAGRENADTSITPQEKAR